MVNVTRATWAALERGEGNVYMGLSTFVLFLWWRMDSNHLPCLAPECLSTGVFEQMNKNV